MDQVGRKISKYIDELNNSINQFDLTGIYTLHPAMAEYILFSNVYGTFTNIGHILGYSIGNNTFNRIKLINVIFTYHSGIKLERNQ